MDYVPHTDRETREMLEFLGLKSTDDLFESIPAELKNRPIAFPPPVSELEITRLMNRAARENAGGELDIFAGGGAYDHFVPEAVAAMVSRGDFATAYTPYQPEASQGTLQAIFEFQTLLCRLTGMEAANASMYEGATSLAEAALMACRVTRKERVLVSDTINRRYLRVLETYLGGPGIEWETVPSRDGVTDTDALRGMLDGGTAAFFLQNPNRFGVLEPVNRIGELMGGHSALLGAAVYPHSLGLLQPPGNWGADIVVGDLQSIGLPLAFGGPYAGFVATRQHCVRQLPGRLAGRTKDADGKTGYVLTLQTREQQIRRSKATSNICTNQALCALAVTVYLSLMGSNGLRRAAEASVRNARALQEKLCAVDGVKLLHNAPFFNEFAVTLPIPVKRWIEAARAKGILAGVPVPAEGGSPEALLVCATEKTAPESIERYAELLSRECAAARAAV